MHNQTQLWYICPIVADEKKFENTSTLAKWQRKHHNETQQFNQLQPLNTSDMVFYHQNNNWTWILNNDLLDVTNC